MPAFDLFATADGQTVPAVTSDEMREVDRLAIGEHGPNLYQMMENAGRNLALTAIDLLGPGWRQADVLVLAGTGGNGGGGITAARHLANHGGTVTLAITNSERLGRVPGDQLRLYDGTSGSIAAPGAWEALIPDLIIDAIIGYSLSGAPRDVARDMIQYANSSPAPVLSLDTPSGLDTTSGAAPGVVVEAQATLTLALPKTGLTARMAGDLTLGDIGIPAIVYRDLGMRTPPVLFDHRYRLPLVRL